MPLKKDIENITSKRKHRKLKKWMSEAAVILDINPKVQKAITGVVFEVRQGYKSKDSKRQNADIANAATAYTKGYLPCAAILSMQIDNDIAIRYTTEKWLLLKGSINTDNSHESVYAFMEQVVGYDLSGFFERNKNSFKRKITVVLKSLLEV